MSIKFSEGKLILSLVLFTASLTLACYAIFFTPSHSTNKVAFVFMGLALGRFSILLYKNAKQKFDNPLKSKRKLF